MWSSTVTVQFCIPPSNEWEFLLLHRLWGGSVVKKLPASAGDAGSITGLGRSPGGGNSSPLQYSCLENPRDRRAWQAIGYVVAESWTQLCSWAGEGNGTPLQYSCLENPKDGGAWWAAVHGVVKSWTRLSDFIFTFHFHALEKAMATHSSVLAWRIPGTGEPGGLLSMGSHRVRHDWSDLAAAAAADSSCCTAETNMIS